LVRGSALILPG